MVIVVLVVITVVVVVVFIVIMVTVIVVLVTMVAEDCCQAQFGCNPCRSPISFQRDTPGKWLYCLLGKGEMDLYKFPSMPPPFLHSLNPRP